MTLNSRSDSVISKDKNLILVSNNSDLFGGGFLYSRNSSHGPTDFRRNSSIGNLFQGFQQENRIKQDNARRQQQLTDAQRYAQECLQYQKYLFDEKIRLIIHRMAMFAYQTFRDKTSDSFLTFFIERFLCNLAKKLLLNRFELLFLEYVLQETKWRYDFELISNCALEFKSFVHIPESENSHGLVKNLQVYLLFCAYYSKKSLNDIANEGIFNYFLKTIGERFKERYQQWTQISGVIKIKINPKILNVIFRKLTSFQQKQKDYSDNYNLIVEQILEISPAYNADKESKGKRKKRKVEQQFKQYPIQFPESNNIQEQENQINSLAPEESPQFPILGFRKQATSYISNVDGLDPVAYSNRNER